ncbi:MAG: hypothetical protein K0R85_253 [Devosia sp.]|jgi:hypothetical protein|nr:hypothetical protein [Devosia sp.]
MYRFTVFEDRFGAARILTNGECSTLQTAMGHGAPGQRQVLIGEALDGELFYFLDYQPVPRLALAPEAISIAADGLATAQLDGLPAGTLARILRRSDDNRAETVRDWDEVDDGIFGLRTAVPGSYELQIEPPFPFRRQTVKVMAQ